MVKDLLPFFSPHGVVVIGASTSPEKLGYGMARRVIPHVGVVKSGLRLFDELVKYDEEEVLKEMREVIEGS
jgi:acyl-CoA synthetase (NDP forming)